MTPAPVTPAIPGHTPHSRAEDHVCPPADNSARIRSSLPPGIVSDTTPGRHPADRTQPHDNRPPAASFARGNETAQQGSGATAFQTRTHHRRYSTGNPIGADRHPDIAQIEVICVRPADRDVYPMPKNFGDMRGLQPSDYRLFVTVCHRTAPTANRAR
jgi:hypothetical protein